MRINEAKNLKESDLIKIYNSLNSNQSAETSISVLVDFIDHLNVFTDHHSGFYKIEAPDTVTIEDRKQMTNWGGLIVDGTLNVDGQLIIEA